MSGPLKNPSSWHSAKHALDEGPTLRQTDEYLYELAVIRRKDPEIHQLADALLDHRQELTRLATAAAS
jgi:hypothetical protein